MILRSASSGRYYEVQLRNSGLLYLVYRPSGLTPDHVTHVKDRCIINAARTAAFVFNVKDTDLAHPLITLTQHENIHLGRAYVLFSSPNQREWEVTCGQSGVYHIKALTIDWPRARAPIVSDSVAGGPWSFLVSDGGEFSIADTPTDHLQSCILKSQDGTVAYQVTVANGIIQVSDPLPSDYTAFYDAELVSPNGLHWLLRIDQNGIIYVDTEWQDAINRPGDEWPLLLADKRGTMYCLDSRFPPPIPGYAPPRASRTFHYW
jgi:hypothetical protein